MSARAAPTCRPSQTRSLHFKKTTRRRGFIKRIDGNRIEFDQANLRAELFDQITPADLRWIGERMSRLTNKQWRDAFRAAAYEDDALVNRFIARMKQKINQALRAQADAAN